MSLERRKKLLLHKVFLSLLCFSFGLVLFFLIGILMASDIIAAEAKNPKDNMECDFCEETIRIILEEERARIAAERAKQIAEARGIIYLTFDDGPGEYTERLLDILEEYDTKVTFFVTGRGDDALIKREYDGGHTVALHTWSHDYAYIYNNTDNYYADLAQVADRVKRVTGSEAKLIRFPGGSSNTISRKYDGRRRIMSILTDDVEKRGYQYFDWNVDSDDAGRADSPDAVYNNVVSHLKDGANVVLQHDIKEYSVEAVARIIEYGNNNGFVFEPLSENSPKMHHGVNN